MNILKMFFRDKQTMAVDAIETWIVRWSRFYNHRGGSSYGDASLQYQAFPTKEAAQHFYDALEDAEKLTKSNFGAVIYKQEI